MSVRFEGVTFRYPGADAPALRDVSTDISSGMVTLVTGRAGAGATTLLLAAAGFAPRLTGGALSGRVTTLGLDPGDPASRSALAGRVGVLLASSRTQLSGIATTVHDEVAYGPANLGWDRQRIDASVRRALMLLESERLAERDPRTLSGGELQCVLLASIVAMEPEVYLLDEPMQGLDGDAAGTVHRVLALLARDAAVCVAGFDADDMAVVAERAIVLEDGRIIADGPTREVLASERVVAAGCSTSIAALARASGTREPHPVTVADAIQAFSA